MKAGGIQLPDIGLAGRGNFLHHLVRRSVAEVHVSIQHNGDGRPVATAFQGQTVLVDRQVRHGTRQVAPGCNLQQAHVFQMRIRMKLDVIDAQLGLQRECQIQCRRDITTARSQSQWPVGQQMQPWLLEQGQGAGNRPVDLGSDDRYLIL